MSKHAPHTLGLVAGLGVGALDDQVEVITPSLPVTELLGDVYKSIVERESASPDEIETVRTLTQELIAKERLDGIVMAGTDWSFVFHPKNTGFPHIDGARTHIQAIMDRLIGSATATHIPG